MKGKGQEWDDINENGQLNPCRNHGRRITGPWIFGGLEFAKQSDGYYISSEVRLFVVEKLISRIIIANYSRKRCTGSDYMEWNDDDGLIHESMNCCERFVTEHEIHAQNIERKGVQTCTCTRLHELYLDRDCDVIWGGEGGEGAAFRIRTLLQAVRVVQDSHVLNIHPRFTAQYSCGTKSAFVRWETTTGH
ncbi:hypothetical protein RF11_06568 [Thelohanellus kitauei]|uniref:Uncharacterized protein n=1 Tax=Thelohanellus kitauei TaxID=669202 RepID=A0A0C2N441_THEKT|nr:hypothetical protein RF11_06568 [Thelohanellus kitauei]